MERARGTAPGMSGYEPVLHALSVEPRVARPGGTVRVVFRTRNLGGLPSPAATVRFMLPVGLEAIEPLGAATVGVRVEPVAPGADVVASATVRVAAGLDDRTELVVRAALELPDGVLGTNACTVVVRSGPRLDGPGSGVAVVALDREIVRVRATVLNEGDGPARGLRVAVPVPAGCIALEGEAATRFEVARLEVGERAAVSYDARIVAPVEVVRAEAYAAAEGMRCALPVREVVVPVPVLLAPRVTLVPGRRRADATIELRNDGWADARDVALRIALRSPLRVLGGSLAVDGVPADEDGSNGFVRVERGGAGLALVVARVPARERARIVLAVHVPPSCDTGALEVVLGEHVVSVPVSAAPVRDVRLRVMHAPAAAEPGAQVELVAELANAGDLSETLIVSAYGDALAEAGRTACADVSMDTTLAEPTKTVPTTIAPGGVVTVPLVVRLSDDVADDARLALTVVACDAGGERARTELTLTARDRPWLALSALPAREGERVAYALHNAGSTTARAVVARVGDEVHQLGAIAPGGSASFAVSERAARRGGFVSVNGREELLLPTLDERPPAEVRAALDAPASVVAGAPFAVRAEIAVATAVEALVVRVPAAAHAAYVAGSTTLDGRALLDRGPGSPLVGDGLLLRGVPAGARIALAWSVLADAGSCEGRLEIAGELVVDGDARAIDPVQVAVRPREAFAARPAGLAYHVDACTLAPDGTLVPDRPAVSEETPAFHRTALPDGTPVADMALANDVTLVNDVTLLDGLLLDGGRHFTVDAPECEPPHAVAEELFAASAVAAADGQDAFTFALRLDGARLEEIARLLHGARGNGLAAHLLAVRALFPEHETSEDVLVASALGAAHDALRDVFDRLFVKLRIPGFDVAASDLEDPALRRALVRLFERLLTARPGGDALEGASGRLAGERVRDVLSSFADAPFGAPAVLRALVALLPTSCAGEPALGAALARYAAALDDALARYANAPARGFDDALATSGDAALDDARADLLAALGARVTGSRALG